MKGRAKQGASYPTVNRQGSGYADLSLTGPTPELTKRITDLILQGYSLNHAASWLGIGKGRVKRWMMNAAGDEATPNEVTFASAIDVAMIKAQVDKRATDERAIQRLAQVINDDDNPASIKVSQWWLERRDPDFQPKQQHDLRTSNQQPELAREEMIRELKVLVESDDSNGKG